jgi:diaminopimelate decarboxylase
MNPLFLTREQIQHIRQTSSLPVYVYSEAKLLESADAMLAMPNAYGLSVRYAMKANSNQNILRLFSYKGIKIDASSEYEALRALSIGVPSHDIELCGQEMPTDLAGFVNAGMEFLATSLYQLEAYGKLFPGTGIGIRVNPGEGSGAFKKISTGGRTSAFGIWYEQLDQVKAIATKYALKITKIHQHIGSENTPEAWVESAKMGLNICDQFPDATTFNMGGGFKMAIMPAEKTADLQGIGNLVKAQFEAFYEKTGRKLTLEIEPGKYLVINSCSVI